MKRIFIIEKITISSLTLSLFLKIFFNKVYYRELSSIFKNESLVKFFDNLGILCLSFKSLDNIYYNRSFNIRRKIELKLFDNFIRNNFFFKSFSKKYNPNLEKLKLCLMPNDSEGTYIETLSLSLIEKYFTLKENKVFYFPIKISSYLLLKNHDKNLKVFSVFVIINIIKIIFYKFLNTLKLSLSKKKNHQKTKVSKSKKKYDFKEFEIAYFPHKSLKYSNSYNKTFIFSEKIESKFYKSKVLNILKEPVDNFSLKYFDFYQIPYLNVKSFYDDFRYKKMFYIFKNFINFKFYKNISIFKILLSFYILNKIYQIEKYIFLFEKLNKLKIIYCDYDSLFPKTILLACDIKKIKTVSNQERYLLNYLISPLFFNYYLVPGVKYENELKEKGYIVDKYFSVGSLRSSSNLNLKKLNLNKEILRLKNIKKKKILCLGTVIADKYSTDLEGENGSSIQNNIDFFEQIILLAKNFENLYFIIRLKLDENLNLIPKKILDLIDQSENIELNKVSSKVNIYQLLNISNFVIGRYTSLIEESIADGIEAIIFDEKNFFSSIENYGLNKKIILAKNEQDLNYFLKIFEQGKNLYDHNFKIEMNEYFSNNFIKSNPKFKIQKILNELI